MKRIPGNLDNDLRELYSKYQSYTIRSIKRSELKDYTKLNIVAYLFSWPDTIGSGGDVIIITKGGHLFKINYYYGDISYDELLKVIPSLDKDIDDIRPWKEISNSNDWHWLEVRSHCWLRIHESIWDVFIKYADTYGDYLESYWLCVVLESLNVINSIQEQPVEHQRKSFGNAVKELLSDGAIRYNDLKIKDVKLNQEKTYLRITLNVDPSIPGMISKDGGTTWEFGSTNHIFTSNYALAQMIREDEEKSWLAYTLIENPETMIPILNGGTIDIVQQRIEAGIPYRSPFSIPEKASVVTFTHETFINHVIRFNYGSTGQRYADELAVRMMGF